MTLSYDDPMQVEEVLDKRMEATLNHRLLPGEGCIDLPTYVSALREIGAEPVYDVEVFKDSLRGLPAAERARQLYESCRVVL